MNFSKTTLYSVQVLKFMADNPHKRFSSSALHEELGIPYQFLRHIMTSLSKAGFISGNVGRKGGFVICKNLGDISIADIIESTEGIDHLHKCIIGNNDCSYNGSCSLHDFWAITRQEIIQKLQNTTIINFKL